MFLLRSNSGMCGPSSIELLPFVESSYIHNCDKILDHVPCHQQRGWGTVRKLSCQRAGRGAEVELRELELLTYSVLYGISSNNIGESLETLQRGKKQMWYTSLGGCGSSVTRLLQRRANVAAILLSQLGRRAVEVTMWWWGRFSRWERCDWRREARAVRQVEGRGRRTVG
jgi:hypothetical protein